MRHPKPSRLLALALMLVALPLSAQLSDPIPGSIDFGSLSVRIVDWVQVPNSNGLPAQINMAHASPDGTGRVFVNDQRGYLYVIDNNEISEYFDVYSVLTNARTESFFGAGLHTFAFHPEFANNGIFYTVHMEPPSTGTPDFEQTESGSVFVHSIITEWTALNPLANTFSGTHVELLRVEAPTFNHAIQQIGFNPTATSSDPDFGMLYIAHGDGDRLPSARAQNLDSLHGSILRLDTSGNDSRNGRYGIPTDNPFASDQNEDTLGEIWAYGFRNPHRFSWDNETGSLYVADIGENQIEEVNLVERGANYGWNEREGTFLFNQSTAGSVYALPGNDTTFNYTYPVLQYDHDEGQAIVGGYVYRGTQIPELYGMYVFGDIVNGRVYYAPSSEFIQGQQSTIQRLNTLDESGTPASLRSITGEFRVDLKFSVDANNEILILTKADGKIRKLVSAQPQPDSDSDGTPDDTDNCLIVANAAQRDTDNDGFGNACDPDLNNDNVVNFFDLFLFRVVFLQANENADFNGDGIVNNVDLAIFASFFLQPPGPSAN